MSVVNNDNKTNGKYLGTIHSPFNFKYIFLLPIGFSCLVIVAHAV
jgi:hypothetical protein